MTSETQPAATAAATPQPPPSDRHCVNCGQGLEQGWAFCGDCGAPIVDHSPTDAADDTSTSVLTSPVPILFSVQSNSPALLPIPTVQVPAKRPPRRWSGGQIVTASVLALILLGLVAAAGYWQRQTQIHLDSARADLMRTRTQLNTRTAALNFTKGKLGDVQANLVETRGQLDNTQRQLDEAHRQLSGLRGSLSNAQSQLDLQANQIETLKNCLNGVTSSLGYAAQSDYTAALAALDAVQVSCQRAQSML